MASSLEREEKILILRRPLDGSISQHDLGVNETVTGQAVKTGQVTETTPEGEASNTNIADTTAQNGDIRVCEPLVDFGPKLAGSEVQYFLLGVVIDPLEHW